MRKKLSRQEIKKKGKVREKKVHGLHNVDSKYLPLFGH